MLKLSRRPTEFCSEHPSFHSARPLLGWILSALLTIPAPLVSQSDTLSVSDLKTKSLEDLMQIEVTTLTKRAEPLFTSPAAVQIITQEEIRRSGALTLPEALRIASNLNVAQVDARQWAISARGFNGTTSNKLLVMIDGRVVYTPLFSGVFWDVQNTYLKDIERIEAISGPGGTLWGANAVNGIINVITKKSSEASAQGLHVYGGIGTEHPGIGGARYGGRIGDHGAFRLYGMWLSQNETKLGSGQGAKDDWSLGQAGVRTDWDFERSSVIAHADVYSGEINQPVGDNIVVRGGNLMVGYQMRLSEISTVDVSGYADIAHRRIPGTFGEDLSTFDIDGQHSLSLANHSILWGFGFRHFNDRVVNSPGLAFLPANTTFHLVSAFIQDEITLVRDLLYVTIGSKFERNHHTGIESQPSARFSVFLSSDQFLWAAISRSVRTPSRIDRELFIPANPPHVVLAGGSNFRSEDLTSIAVGYRYSGPQFSLSGVAFHHTYDHLRSLEPGPPPVLANGLEATSTGAEVSMRAQLADWWNIHAGYTLFSKVVTLKPGSNDINGGQSEGNDPRHMVKLHASMDLPWAMSFDAWFRLIDELPNANARVPSYASLDARLSADLSKNISISVVGRHLLQKSHAEFGAPVSRKFLERQVFARAALTL